jgi:hypothetical protein
MGLKIKNAAADVRTRLLLMSLSCVVAFASMTALASAQTAAPTVDYSDVTDGATSQINTALPIALGFFGVVAGILLGIGFLRKITGAKKAPSA